MIFYANYSKNLELLFALDKLNIVRNKRGLRIALKMFHPLSFPIIRHLKGLKRSQKNYIDPKLVEMVHPLGSPT